jgi:hypothetical protein
MEHNPRHVFVALLRPGQFQDFFVDCILLDLPPYVPQGRSTEDIYKMLEKQRAEHPQPAGSGFGFNPNEDLGFNVVTARYVAEYPQPPVCGKGPHAGFG